MTTYKQILVKQGDSFVVDITCIKRLADNAFIPFDPANTDYQAYLAWLTEGNAPIGADEPLPAEETPTTNTQE
jgi:hypothetical protein